MIFPAFGSTKAHRACMDLSSAEKPLASLRVWNVLERSLDSPGSRYRTRQLTRCPAIVTLWMEGISVGPTPKLVQPLVQSIHRHQPTGAHPTAW